MRRMRHSSAYISQPSRMGKVEPCLMRVEECTYMYKEQSYTPEQRLTGFWA